MRRPQTHPPPPPTLPLPHATLNIPDLYLLVKCPLTLEIKCVLFSKRYLATYCKRFALSGGLYEFSSPDWFNIIIFLYFIIILHDFYYYLNSI